MLKIGSDEAMQRAGFAAKLDQIDKQGANALAVQKLKNEAPPDVVKMAVELGLNDVKLDPSNPKLDTDVKVHAKKVAIFKEASRVMGKFANLDAAKLNLAKEVLKGVNERMKDMFNVSGLGRHLIDAQTNYEALPTTTKDAIETAVNAFNEDPANAGPPDRRIKAKPRSREAARQLYDRTFKATFKQQMSDSLDIVHFPPEVLTDILRNESKQNQGNTTNNTIKFEDF